MPDDTIKTLFREAVTDTTELIEAKLELLQLKLADKGAKAAASGLYGLIIYLIAKFSILMLLICGGFAFALMFIQNPESNQIIQGLLFGFLCILGVTVLALGIILLIKKKIQGKVEGKVINQVLDKMEEQERKKEVEALIIATSETLLNEDEPTQEIEITNIIND